MGFVTAHPPFPDKWHHSASEPKDPKKWSKTFLGIWIHCSPVNDVWRTIQLDGAVCFNMSWILPGSAECLGDTSSDQHRTHSTATVSKKELKNHFAEIFSMQKQKMIKSYPLPGVWSGGGVEMCRSLEIWENPCSTGFHLEEMENPGGSFCAHYTFVAQNSLWPHRDKNPCWNLHLHPAKIVFLIATGALGEFLLWVDPGGLKGQSALGLLWRNNVHCNQPSVTRHRKSSERWGKQRKFGC